jgi:hypothetical protein
MRKPWLSNRIFKPALLRTEYVLVGRDSDAVKWIHYCNIAYISNYASGQFWTAWVLVLSEIFTSLPVLPAITRTRTVMALTVSI